MSVFPSISIKGGAGRETGRRERRSPCLLSASSSFIPGQSLESCESDSRALFFG